MGIALNEDAIGALVRDEDGNLRDFQGAMQRHMEFLRGELRATREKLAAADRLSWKQAEEIAKLKGELARYKGQYLTPRPGCEFHEIGVGDATLLVEVDVDPGEPATADCPATPETVTPQAVLINGALLFLDDLSAALDFDVLEQRITDMRRGG